MSLTARGEPGARARRASPRRSGAGCSRRSWPRPAPRRSWARRSASGSASRLRSPLLVFTALGLGMSAPYLLLSASPAAAALRPEARALDGAASSSSWASRMLATVVFLAWLFGQQTGVDGMACCSWPRSCPCARGLGLRPRARTAALAGRPRRRDGPGGRAGRWRASSSALARATRRRWRRRRPWPTRSAGSPSRSSARAELRAQGTPVFIDFTAAWCLTCQVNERVALRRAGRCAERCASRASCC